MKSPELQRSLGVFSCSAIIISNMVGSGIFTTTGYLAGDLGSPPIILAAWVVGGLIAACGALCYAELGVNFSHSGGEYIYLKESYGEVWGFINGWISFFAGFSGPIAAAAMGFAGYLIKIFPNLTLSSSHISLLVVSILSLINIFSNRQVSFLQNSLTTIKILALMLLIVFGFTVGTGSWTNLEMSTTRTSHLSIYQQFSVSLIFILFAYSGWNAANYIVEETKSPKETLPKSIFLGLGLVSAFYLLLNVLFIYALPLEKLKGEIAIGTKVSLALFGPVIGSLFGVLFCLSLLATINAMVFIGPRVYLAMARDRLFFSWANDLHPRFKSPYKSVLAQWGCIVGLILTGTFESLVTYIGICLTLFSILSVTAIFKFRKRKDWQRLPALDRFFPWLPLVFIFFSSWIIIYTATFNLAALGYGLLTMLGGYFTYYFLKKK